MKRRLHIIAACADRKRLPAPRKLRLRAHRSVGTRARFQSFVDALAAASGTTLSASDLYVGAYWAAIRELPALAATVGFQADLWVASAGYGLIPATASIHPYSATFQVGSPDSVASGRTEHSVREQVSAWWCELATWDGPSRHSPRRVRDLASTEPAATMIVIASPRYVQAMGADLQAAGRTLGDRLILVTSVPPESEPDLARHLVPSEAPLVTVVGGSLPSLHARVARDIICHAKTHRLSAPVLRARYQDLILESNYSGMPDRDSATDAEVMAFIRRALKRTPTLKHSPALRMWRDGGRACEQKRFKRLFHDVVARHG